MPDGHVRGLREGVSPQNHKFLSVCNPKTTSFYLHLSQQQRPANNKLQSLRPVRQITTMSSFTSFTTTTTRFSGLIVKQLQLLQQQSSSSSSVVFKEILEKPKGQICVVRDSHGNFYLWISKGGEHEWKHPVRIVAVSTIKFVEAKKLASQTRSYARGLVSFTANCQVFPVGECHQDATFQVKLALKDYVDFLKIVQGGIQQPGGFHSFPQGDGAMTTFSSTNEPYFCDLIIQK
jgi:hypothetical protein